jgi:RNA polymerase sigma-70 factor, ECF subfamily
VETVDTADLEARRARFDTMVRGVVEPLRRFLARRTDAATADDVL